MNQEKCPSCGAPVESESTTCQYCKSKIRDISGADWVAVKDRLPEPSSGDPQRSEMVLICPFTEALKYMPLSDNIFYQNYIISAYYDLESGKWKNEQFDETTMNMVNNMTTHWMPLPAADDSQWNDISKTGLPLTPESDASDETLSIRVLINIVKAGYPPTICAAGNRLDREGWFSMALSITNNVDFPVDKWMPLPAPPALA
jgi:endogenous inhibitor of DNA gyrase (YacG/DUF329 family)